MFVDDSGQAGIKCSRRDNGLYVLGGTIVHEAHWKGIESDLAFAKRKFFPTLDPDKWELHAHDMWNSKGIFADEKLSINYDQKINIFSEVMRIACVSDVTFVGVVILKDKLKDESVVPRVLDRAWPILIDQFEHYLKQQPDDINTGLLCIDASDRPTELYVSNLISKSVKRGTLLQGIDCVVEHPLFIKSHLSGLIQLSDMIAYVIHRYHRGDHKFKAWFEMLLQKTHWPRGGLAGRGIRTFP